MISKSTMFILAMAMSSSAFAGENATIENVYVYGKGCPHGSYTSVKTDSTAEVTLNNFNTALYYRRSFKDRDCKIELAVRVPAGYTLPGLDVNVEGRRTLAGPRAQASVYGTLKTSGLTYSGTIFQDGFQMTGPSTAQEVFSEEMSYSDIGDVNASECNRERVAILKVTLRAVLRHRGSRAADHSYMWVDKADFALPAVDGFTAIACNTSGDTGGSTGGGWGNGGWDWGWGW